MAEAADDPFDNWTVQVRKGILELCILNALEDRERYGYELVKTLAALPGFGVTEGTLSIASNAFFATQASTVTRSRSISSSA